MAQPAPAPAVDRAAASPAVRRIALDFQRASEAVRVPLLARLTY